MQASKHRAKSNGFWVLAVLALVVVTISISYTLATHHVSLRLDSASRLLFATHTTPCNCTQQQPGNAVNCTGVSAADKAPTGSSLSDGLASLVVTNLSEAQVAHNRVLPLSEHEKQKFDVLPWIIAAQQQEPNLSPQCNQEFGLEYIKQWRVKKYEFCKEDPPQAGAVEVRPTSRIDLYPTVDYGKPLMFGTTYNTVLNSRAFIGEPTGPKKQDQQNQWPVAAPGSFEASCTLNKRDRPMQLGQRQAISLWMNSALKASQQAVVEGACAADSPHVVDHPVFFISRYDSTSAYHNMEDVLTTFITLAVLDSPAVKEQGVQIVLADHMMDGFYLHLYNHISLPYKLRILADDPYPNGTCFRQTIHNAHAMTSILSAFGVGNPVACPSPVVQAGAAWLRHVMADVIAPPPPSEYDRLPQNEEAAIKHKTVVWVSRRNFEGMYSKGWTWFRKQRMFSNEGEVVLALQREIWKWNDEACMRQDLSKSIPDGRRLLWDRPVTTAMDSISRSFTTTWQQWFSGWWAGIGNQHLQPQRAQGRRLLGECRHANTFFQLRVVEFSDLPFFPDQLQALKNMAIIVGVHGAGMTNLMWMQPKQGAVLEIHHNSGGNLHFHNMAKYLGHHYRMVNGGGDRVDAQTTAQVLRGLMDLLA